MQITFAPAAPDAEAPIVRLASAGELADSFAATTRAAASRSRFKGNAGQLVESYVEHDGAVQHLIVAGTGKPDSEERLPHCERAGAAVAARFQTAGFETVVIDFTDSGLDAEAAAAVLLGLRLRSWRYEAHRTTLKDEQKVSLKKAVAVNAPDGTEAAWADSAALAVGIEFTKELVTEPANVIYPVTFVERVRERLEGTGAKVSVLGKAEMTDLGMGALLGVSQGSIREPQLLCIEWHGGGGERPTAFVGKGVTFDTGGISLKQPGGMEDMKWDMGGAGAVAGAMLALAKRKAKANIIGVCGLVENMPDAEAQRPGDVVTSMSGQTVEVINTDAEGRLVLCDALTWVQRKHGPQRIVDLATLTGAMIIALGHEHGGMFSNDDALADDLAKAGKATGDKLWRFPLTSAYDKLLDSPIADMRNVGPREAGSITAAQYLQRFIENDTPWAHLDIAGMVWSGKPGATWDKGATGYGVRVLDRLVRDTLES